MTDTPKKRKEEIQEIMNILKSPPRMGMQSCEAELVGKLRTSGHRNPLRVIRQAIENIMYREEPGISFAQLRGENVDDITTAIYVEVGKMEKGSDKSSGTQGRIAG